MASLHLPVAAVRPCLLDPGAAAALYLAVMACLCSYAASLALSSGLPCHLRSCCGLAKTNECRAASSVLVRINKTCRDVGPHFIGIVALARTTGLRSHKAGLSQQQQLLA